MKPFIIAFIGILLITVLLIASVEHFVPNFNYDSGVNIARMTEFTQPQQIASVGTGDNPNPELENMVYPKYGPDYIRNLYDYGNIFHIPTSVTNNSDTTEDGLQAFVLERSRYSDKSIR